MFTHAQRPFEGTPQEFLCTHSLVLYLKILTVYTGMCFLHVHVLEASIRHQWTVLQFWFQGSTENWKCKSDTHPPSNIIRSWNKKWQTDNSGVWPFGRLQCRWDAWYSNRSYFLKCITHTNLEPYIHKLVVPTQCLPLKTVIYKTCNICWHCIWMTKSNIWNKWSTLGVSDYTPMEQEFLV
jgi:hypothetical protein